MVSVCGIFSSQDVAQQVAKGLKQEEGKTPKISLVISLGKAQEEEPAGIREQSVCVQLACPDHTVSLPHESVGCPKEKYNALTWSRA